MPIAAIALPIVGAIIGAHAAGKAANAQAKASDSATQVSRDALDFQKQQWAQQQQNEAPWLKAGGEAEAKLSSMVMGGEFPDWNEQFKAPTDVTEQNDPGYKFRLQEGQKALENSAAARGGLLSGNTAKAITDYSQNYASNEYANVYGRAFNEYSTRYNQFETNQANKFNRLSSLAGGGQVAAGQLGQQGQAASVNIANLAGQQGQFMQNAGAARASGYIGAANAWNQGLGGSVNSLNQFMLLNSLAGG